MRFDDLSKPVSEEAPAGPDLDEAMDADYLNYTLVAADRLPASYLIQVPGGTDRKPFDRSVIDLDTELETIAGLLGRSRDVRLLTLDARFNAAAGNLVGFCEAVEGLAIVVGAFWDSFHPGLGDMIIRQNTIESIDSPGQVVLHLQNAAVAGGGRTRPVTLRHYLVATGKAEAREDEDLATLDQISATLTNTGETERVNAVHGAIEAARGALDTLRRTFLDRAGSEFALSFDNLDQLFSQILAMIGAFRTDLAPPAEAGTQAAAEVADGAGGRALLGAVKSHADATGALAAAETYFLRLEPSSPALILIHQARMLIGRPLVYALEALMPDASTQAALRFDGGFRFNIDMTRMKNVTDEALAESGSTGGYGGMAGSSDGTSAADWDALSSAAETEDSSGGDSSASETEVYKDSGETEAESAGVSEGPDEGPAPPVAVPPPAPSGPAAFHAATRGQAVDLLQAAETFFRTAEPSSSIPLLLSKARGYVSRDFASILSEIMPREDGGG